MLVILVLFLMNQRNLGDRLHRLLKQRGIGVSRRILEEAGEKVSSYFLMESLINVAYGGVVVLGTWLLKVPQPLFWGSLAFLFRFIPYIGTWLVAILALALSLAMTPSWIFPALLVIFWFTLERITADLVESWVYRKRIGISSVGVMVSATFWSWAWGIPGLMIATPLTACLVELGVEIPGLNWINTLFSAQPASFRSMAGGSSGREVRDRKVTPVGANCPVTEPAELGKAGIEDRAGRTAQWSGSLHSASK